MNWSKGWGMTGESVPRQRLSRQDSGIIEVPRTYVTALIYVDESGAKGSGSQFFVTGAVKCREPGFLMREIFAVRQRYRFDKELKFSAATHGSTQIYFDIIDVLARSDARLAA